MSVRVAVIGAGVMGADHARILAGQVKGAAVQVVCDADADRARSIAGACGGDAATDALATIQRADVDAVLIASPDESHAAFTLAAIAAGKPVLCEKPLAPGSDDCLTVVAKEADTGRQWVHVGFMRRFDPAYAQMREALTTGRIGAAVMMHNLHRNVQAPPHFAGAMAITNSAPHEFDIIRYVLGTDITAISAHEPQVDTGAPCRPVVMVAQTASGQLATNEVNVNAAYGYDVRAELVGTAGSVSFGGATSVNLDTGLAATRAYDADWRPRFADAYRLQNQAWIRTIQTGAPCPDLANAWDGYCAARIAEVGAKALGAGGSLTVDLAGMPAFYAGLAPPG